MIITVILLSLLVVILGFTTFNLLRKNEAQEDILASYMTYLNKISDIIEVSNKKIKKLIHVVHLNPMMKLVGFLRI